MSCSHVSNRFSYSQSDSNRVTAPYMNKISCEAAGKYDLSYDFANVWGGDE